MSLVIRRDQFVGIYLGYNGTNIMSFEMVDFKKLFCQKYT